MLRVAIDNNVISWKAGQGSHENIRKDKDKYCDYLAIQKLFSLQDDDCIILVGIDKVDRERQMTSNAVLRLARDRVWQRCKEKYLLTRFEQAIQSKKQLKSPRENGINLEDGAHFIDNNSEDKIAAYVEFGTTQKDKVDLEVLATVAIANIQVFITVDYKLLHKQHILDFVKQNDDICIFRPSDFLNMLASGTY
jgi:predicted nucleic acid-binding protein